ncbi:MAG: hypothetical protein E7329_02520 [Clostridiales bacterium]|nr:hypothetical protein [Clostridiales bacterium]
MKKKDLIILLGAVLLIGLVFLISHLAGFGTAPLGTVRIYVNGELYREERLGQSRDIEIEQATGEKNILHLTENGFYMAHSTCQNQLCVQQGQVTSDNYYLRAMGSRVICLPNRVEAELTLINQTPPPDMPDL